MLIARGRAKRTLTSFEAQSSPQLPRPARPHPSSCPRSFPHQTKSSILRCRRRSIRRRDGSSLSSSSQSGYRATPDPEVGTANVYYPVVSSSKPCIQQRDVPLLISSQSSESECSFPAYETVVAEPTTSNRSMLDRMSTLS